MNTRWTLGLVVGALVLALFAWGSLPESPPIEPEVANHLAGLSEEIGANSISGHGSHNSDHDGQPLRSAGRIDKPTSLRGTQPDGSLSVDAEGRLIADLSVKRRLDYWLSGLGELSLAEIRQLVFDDGLEVGDDRTATQLLALFDRYVDYLQTAETVAMPTLDPADSAQAHGQLMALRRQLLGAEWADAFFGAEERSTVEQLVRLDIVQDPNLSEGQRADAIEQWGESLPEAEQAVRKRATAHHRIAEEITTADATQRSRWTETHGPEVANRLVQLQASNGQWQETLAAFTTQYRSIMTDPALTQAAQTQRIRGLLAPHSLPTQRRLLSMAQVALRLEEDG